MNVVRRICMICVMATSAIAHAAETAPLAGITLAKDCLSVNLQEVPLAAVVTAIADRSGIELHMENAAQLPRVTARFTDVPFAEGLARLLKTVPGSLVVRGGKRGYGGVSGLYVIGSQGQAAPLPTAAPPSMEDIRRNIESLGPRAVSPDVRQAYEAALAPLHGNAAPSPSARRARNLDNMLREIGGATVRGATPAENASDPASR